MKMEYIQSSDAPQAIGPYSQAVKIGNLVFLSGQLPLDPATGELTGGDVEVQTRLCMENILGILRKENLAANNIIKTTIYLRDMDAFSLVNEVYATYFNQNYPARVCIEVSRLPKGADVEIEAIAGF